MQNLPKNWEFLFSMVKTKDYFCQLSSYLDEEYSKYIIYPKRENIFKAFELVSPKDIKVVIIGQDPYHEVNQAMGLAFSVVDGNKLPPSLVNIYREIENEYNCLMNYQSGDLAYLAKQGVLLLNSIFTVREHQPLSHDTNEYKLFYHDIISYLNTLNQNIVFLLWGKNAQKIAPLLTNDQHLVLFANHPSPLSANRGGWFNCNHFLKANEFLKSHQLKTIDWCNLNQ